MTRTFSISVEAIEPSGVVLTIAESPRLVIFADTAEDWLQHAREAIAFRLRDAPDGDKQAPLELVLGWALAETQPNPVNRHLRDEGHRYARSAPSAPSSVQAHR